jgi:hypothetical protein
MNNPRKSILLGCVSFAMLLGVCAPRAAAQTSAKSGDEFFVISSIDRTKHLLVLLQATEISETMSVGDKTQFFDERGKALKLTDLRSGDTVYITSHKQQDGSLIADKVREGTMTVSELRRRYVPYLPATASQFSPGSAPKQ